MSYQGYGNSGGGGYGQNSYGGGNGGGYGSGGYGNNGNNHGYGNQDSYEGVADRYGGNQGAYNGGYSNNGYGQGMEMHEHPQNNYDNYNSRPQQPQQYQPQQQQQPQQSQPAPPYSASQPSNNTGGDDTALLDQTFVIDTEITELESRLATFRGTQSRVLQDRATYNELDASASDIMGGYRALAQRMKRIKQKPASGSPRNAPQVGRVDRRLKASMTSFQKLESEFRAKIKEQQERQYRIVNPQATDEEVYAAVDSPDTQIFQQALLNADRRGQSQTALSAVRQRHDAIQNIERTMVELAELFQDLDTLVMEQDVMVKEIEAKAEAVHEDVEQANTHLEKGIDSARAARRKKWCLFWFLIILVIVIVAAVVIYIEVTKK